MNSIVTFVRIVLGIHKGDPGDDGYSTEAIVVIALLVGMAIAAVGILSTNVIARVTNLSLGG
ncbi:hypothetical protein ACIBFB_10135 [Nocardiopsis sp. NPDC050513]|uniref:hypothetical protein n=1 Tax=Nocardiopsis sp. NPDC050513 TaxID=3364338 RepID=UPI003789467B